MVKIAFITGMNYPQFAKEGDIEFCLAHQVLVNKKYADHYKNSKKYVIMDNSAAELGESIVFDNYIKAIKMVMPDEIWLPDRLYDDKTTLKWTKMFIKELYTHKLIGNIKLAGIAQGMTLKEWLACYKEMLKIPEINVMVLSKYSVECFNKLAGTKNFALCRIACVDYLHKNKLVKKCLHCGGANNLIIPEMQYYKRYPKVRSIDSNICFKLGCHKLRIDECDIEPKERLNHDIKNLTRLQLDTIKYNIKKVKDAK